jgi:DNA-binding LacI/PurR family transcriptional regulator
VEEPLQPRTIREIAAHLGLSSMTVHRALAGKPDIAARTRDRVLAEVERLGYRPNMAARGLRQGKTFTLGILLSNVAASFLPEVLQGVNQTAEARGYHSIVCVHEHQPERAIGHLQMLQSKGVDGIVYYPTEAGTEVETLNRVARSTPVVVIMRETPGFGGPSVLVDDRLGGALAARHLLDLGHRRIGFIGYSDNIFSRDRRLGFEAALREAGIELRPEWTSLASRHGEAHAAATAVLSRTDRPTALFCASDRLAARAIQVALPLGIRVPEDLSIVGYNGDPWLDLLPVPLTSVMQPRQELGGQAAALVLEPGEREPLPRRVMLDPWLAAGASTAPVDRAAP